MVTSYLLSSTLVPVLSVWLLENRHGTHGHGERPRRGRGSSCGSRTGSSGSSTWTVAHRRMVVLAYLLATGAVVVVVGGQLGRELFPRVDAGQFQLRVRPAAGDPLRADPQGRPEDARRDRRGGRARERRHHDGLRRRRTRRSSPSTWPTSGAEAPTTACSASACARGAGSASSSSRSGCARSCRRRWARGSASELLRAWASPPSRPTSASPTWSSPSSRAT